MLSKTRLVRSQNLWGNGISPSWNTKWIPRHGPAKRLMPTLQWVLVVSSKCSSVPRNRHTIREPAAMQNMTTITYMYGMCSRGFGGAMFAAGSICFDQRRVGRRRAFGGHYLERGFPRNSRADHLSPPPPAARGEAFDAGVEQKC